MWLYLPKQQQLNVRQKQNRAGLNLSSRTFYTCPDNCPSTLASCSEATQLHRQSTHWWLTTDVFFFRLLIGPRVLPRRGYTVTSWVGAPAYAAACGRDYFTPKHCLCAREVLLHQRPNKHRAGSVNQQQVWQQLPGDRRRRRQADWEHTCLFGGGYNNKKLTIYG